MEPPVRIRYRFERYPIPQPSTLETFARAAEQMVRASPAHVGEFPFARTSQVCGGILQTMPAAHRSAPGAADTAVRLKAIECPEGTLLEHTYDNEGHVVQTYFADGACVNYDWAHGPNQRRVSLPGGRSILMVLQNGGCLQSLTYDGRLIFRHEYAEGRLSQLVYPDGEVLRCTYDSQGLPSHVDIGDLSVVYGWEARAAGPRVECEYGSHRGAIGLEGSAKIPLTPIRKLPTGETLLFSALGLWICTPRGELRDLRLPDGQRLCLCPPSFGSASSTWSSVGQSFHDYGDRSVLSAVMDPNGARAMYRPIAGTNHAYLVTGGGVSLCEYDGKGRLQKIRSADGQYASFSYSRDGAVKRVLTSRWWMELRHNHGRLVSIRLGADITGDIAYDADHTPVTLSIRARRQPLSVAAMAVCAALWQWTSVRSTLRLENGTPKKA